MSDWGERILILIISLFFALSLYLIIDFVLRGAK